MQNQTLSPSKPNQAAKPSRAHSFTCATLASLLAGAALPALGQSATAADTKEAAHTYRLTYTVTESDNGHRLTTQHYSLIAATGKETSLKEGSRVPVAESPASLQYMNFDIGLNIRATLVSPDQNDALHSSGSMSLHSAVEQSALSAEKPDLAAHTTVRQTELVSNAILTPGKPLILGSLDVPGSTHHLDIDVVFDPIP